ncbi:MAG TPA: GvpL/GvpF family gas vesicle protein [Nocardioidaceae bacterium]|nr:GvpL/GvpF family gas vesicle protein [Nocardioidaceae bacterium]
MTGASVVSEDRELQVREGEGCYVYGVVPADASNVGAVGLDDAEVHLVRHGPVAAIVSVVRLERPAGRREELLAHSRVLDAFAAGGPVVPVQFGAIVEDARAVREDVLADREQQFVELLAELLGVLQFTLQARYDEATVLAELVRDDPEIAGLREATRGAPEEQSYADRVRLGELVSQRLEARRQIDEQAVLDALEPHVIAHRVRPGASIDHLTDLALLVGDGQREAFENAAEQLAADLHERARLRLMGPMAPYDFVGEE